MFIVKDFEKIMYSRLHEFLEKLDILYEYQFGFTSGDDLDDMYDTANHELNNIAEWLKVNKLSLNVKKPHYMVFSGINSSRSTATHTKNLKIDGEEISEVSKTKFLGVIIDNKLKWQHHIAYIS